MHTKRRSDLLSPKAFSLSAPLVSDVSKFKAGLQLILQSMSLPHDMADTMFCSDNMIAWNRSLSFLRDPFFQSISADQSATTAERGIVWRTYLLEYFAQSVTRLNGAFLEVGCYKGYTASILCERIDFAALGKKYVLYDLFGWSEGDQHLRLEAHTDADLYTSVCQRFSDKPYVSVIKGRVPDTFSNTLPDQIAFAHIDLNDAVAEGAALTAIYTRLSPGGIVVLDDYGWWLHSDQKIAVDKSLSGSGDNVVELPTGQGLLIKR